MFLTLLYLHSYSKLPKVDKVAAFLDLSTSGLLYIEKVMLTSHTSVSVLNFSWSNSNPGTHLTLSNMAKDPFVASNTSSLSNTLSLSILNKFT